MNRRKVHLRVGDYVKCGKSLGWGAILLGKPYVITYSNLDATDHATLVTCKLCLEKLK